MGNLAGKAAKLLGQFHIRHQFGRILGTDRRHVKGIDHRPGQQIIGHLLGHLDSDIDLGFGCRRAQMRRHHHLFHAEQYIFLGRLLGKYINGGGGNLAAFNRRFQILFNHQAAPGAIDDAHAVFHFYDCRSIDDASRGVGHRCVQADEIGAPEHFVQFGLFNADVGGAFGR